MAGTPSPYDEAQLLLQLSAGEHSALEMLYSTYYTRLVHFADQLTHNRQQAEDIVIVAFTRYWERRAGFKHLNSIAAFLYTTIRNDCYKYLQQHHKRQAIANEPLALNDDYIESRIVFAEAVDYIHAEIERLSPHYRDVIRLLFLEEVSVNEAAQRLGITPDNVRKRKERALEQLRNRVLIDKIRPLAFIMMLLMK